MTVIRTALAISAALVFALATAANPASDPGKSHPGRSLSWQSGLLAPDSPVQIAGKGRASDSSPPSTERSVSDDQAPKVSPKASDSSDSSRKGPRFGTEPGFPDRRDTKEAVPDAAQKVPWEGTPGGHPTKFLKPVITHAWMPDPDSGVVYFKGERLGDKPGRIVLYTMYMPGGNSPAGAYVELGNVVWSSSTEVRGRLPSGYRPQSSALCRKQVVFAVLPIGGGSSNRYAMNWPEEERELDYAKVQLKSCGCGANYNTCANGSSGMSHKCDQSDCPYELPHPGTGHFDFGGYHLNCGKIGEVTNAGVDKFYVSLNNGWYFYDFSLNTEKTSNAVLKPSKFSTDKTNELFSFEWTTPKNAWLRYELEVEIKGPAGCSPYK